MGNEPKSHAWNVKTWIEEHHDDMFSHDLEKSGLIEILDRILDKGIVLEPWARVVLGDINLQGDHQHIVLAPDRRRKPYLVRKRAAGYWR